MKVTPEQFKKLAKDFGFPLAHILAVVEVESKGDGFLPDGRPVILFERHKFHGFTKGLFSKDYPGISAATMGGYATGRTPLLRKQNEWNRLSQAIELNREAAFKSCSWGMGQVMGFHYHDLGFRTVQDFVNAMFADEYCQLKAMFHFIKNSPTLTKAIIAGDWATFARGYNGKAYAVNQYDIKLAAASKKFKTVA